MTLNLLYLFRRIIAGPDVEQLLLADGDLDCLVALEYLLKYVAIFLLRGVGHDFPLKLTLLTKPEGPRPLAALWLI